MTRNSQFLSISQAARYLGVSIQTLRNWQKAGTFRATFVSPGGHRYYSFADLERRTKGLAQAALDWASAENPTTIPEGWYCSTSDVFKARLERMTNELLARPARSSIAPLIASAAGEVGNNSYDHNLGNWPDTLGTLFAYDLGKRLIVLADRGVGVLATLRRIRPDLATHKDALQVAFTEIITGRAPEHRGNGLKYVRKALLQAHARLRFWSGDALVEIDSKSEDIRLLVATRHVRGCVAVIEF